MAAAIKKKAARRGKRKPAVKPAPKVVRIPQLDKTEQIELQNIMLRMSLEGEKIKNLEHSIKVAKGEMVKQEGNLLLWKGKFDAKLRKCGVTIEQVDINAENGSVVILGAPEIAGGKNAPSSG